ncbi:MAG: hypothetical protein IKN85_07400 [Oscillospiraceae bacterium]|nr:hypothetical protein [Oscillospiraceae bacterium]
MKNTWTSMKCKQKMRITEMMFNSVLEIYKEKGHMPLEEQYEHIVRDIFPKCNVQKLQYEDLLSVFRRKQKKFAQRIELHGVPDSKPTKDKKTDAEKLAKKRAARKRRRERKRQKTLKEEMERYRDYYDTFCFLDEYESDDELYDQTLEREEKLPF